MVRLIAPCVAALVMFAPGCGRESDAQREAERAVQESREAFAEQKRAASKAKKQDAQRRLNARRVREVRAVRTMACSGPGAMA